MNTRIQTEKYSEGEREFFKSLIGQKLEWLENTEVYPGDTENDGTICSPFIIFENTQFRLINDPTVDEEVDYDKGLFPKPKLIFRETERREPRKYTGRYGEGGLTYEKTYKKIEINMIITEIKILHTVTKGVDIAFFDGTTFVTNLEDGLVFVFEDDSYLIIDAYDEDGDFMEFWRDKDQYVKENVDRLIDDNEESEANTYQELIEFIDITDGSVEIIVNAFRENELEEIING